MGNARNLAKLAVDSNGDVAAASLDNVTPAVGKNRIINGNFLVAQRGTSFTDVVMSGDSLYNFDRWCTARANVGDTGVCTISQVAGGGIRYEVTTADATLTAGSGTALRQIIEGYNCVGLAGNPFTVSFKMKTNKLGTYGVYVYDYTGNSAIPLSINVTNAGTVESYSITFPSIPSITIDNAARLGLNIVLTAEATREGTWYPSGETQVNLFDTVGNYVEIYDVQLETGSVATDFERRPYGTELALCQRYFQKYHNTDSVEKIIPGMAMTFSTTAVQLWPTFYCPMRTSPTLTYSAVDCFNCFSGSGADNSTAISTSMAWEHNIRINITSSNQVQYNPCKVYLNNGDWIAFSAEL